MISISRRCACGCGGVTNPGKKWITHHNLKKKSKETKKKISLSLVGNKNGKGNKGNKLSVDHKKNISISKFKDHPDDQYCEAWRDREYKKEIKKDYCENQDCKETCNRLSNHHINLNKKDCRPFNIITLCYSCHSSLHGQFIQIKNKHDILTINRIGYIRYIHKRTRQVIATIIRIQEDE